MASGNKYLLYISSTGLSGGTMTQLELQGDLTINTGKSNERTGYKNGALTAQGNDGISMSGVVAPNEPLSTAQQYLWTQHLNGGSSYVQVKSATTGSIMVAGPVMLTVTQHSLPNKGPVEWTLDISENGTMTWSTV